MNPKWAWLTTVVAIALVFAHPAAPIAGIIPPDLVTAGALIAALGTTVIAVVGGLANKTLNVAAAVTMIIATLTGPEFGAVLPAAVTNLLLVAAAIVSALSPMAPAAVQARLRAGRD